MKDIYIPDKINGEYVKNDDMAIKKMIIAELEGNPELGETKKVVFDKNQQQFSIKIPKYLALKTELKQDSIFELVINPKDEKTLNEIKESNFIIYLKKNEEGKLKIDNQLGLEFLSSVQKLLGEKKKMFEVVKAVYNRGGVSSAYEISEKAEISYITTQKYLKVLKDMNIVIEIIEDKTQGRIKRYSLNYNYFNSK